MIVVADCVEGEMFGVNAIFWSGLANQSFWIIILSLFKILSFIILCIF